MGNSVAVAKLGDDPENFCVLDDVEICLKGVHEIYTVDEDGNILEHKETYEGESEYGYYYCQGCEGTWDIEDQWSKGRAWAKVKEHLHES